MDGNVQEAFQWSLRRRWFLPQPGVSLVHILRYRTRTEGAIVRNLLFMNIVLPSNVVARSDERGRIIGAFDVEARLSVLAFGRG